MSRRYRARKDRREAWYDERVNMAFSQWSLRDFVVPPPPHPDNYHLLPVADISEFHRFKEDDWYERVSRLAS